MLWTVLKEKFCRVNGKKKKKNAYIEKLCESLGKIFQNKLDFFPECLGLKFMSISEN
jgi:hypothetical protein